MREPAAGGAGRSALRRELDLPEDRFLALFVGRDVPKKRLDVVLGAADPSYEIVAVTDRVSGPPGPGVRLLPFLEHERFQHLLLAVDAFVLPSEAEGIPLALQEALLAGLPSVVAREPGYERALRDGEVVYVEPRPDDVRAALTRLVVDRTGRAELSARAREAGRREFGLERFVAAYERGLRGAARLKAECRSDLARIRGDRELLAKARGPGLRETDPQRRVVAQAGERLGESLLVPFRDDKARGPEHLRDRPARRADDRQPHDEPVRDHAAELLLPALGRQRGNDEAVERAVEAPEPLLRQQPDRKHAPREAGGQRSATRASSS